MFFGITVKEIIIKVIIILIATGIIGITIWWVNMFFGITVKEIIIKVIVTFIATGIIGITIRLTKLYQYFRKKRGPLDGEWYQIIPEFKEESAKKDLVISHQRKNSEKVYGRIRRLEPWDQNLKKWKFEGRLRGDVFCACYWSEDPNQGSFGCWILDHCDEYRYEGYYIRLKHSQEALDKIVIKKRQIPFSWEKKKGT